jgi:hypothetical protein
MEGGAGNGLRVENRAGIGCEHIDSGDKDGCRKRSSHEILVPKETL